MNSKWVEVKTGSALFGEVAGYVVCVARVGKKKWVGLSFCNPRDRASWNRDTGVKLASARSKDAYARVGFDSRFTVEEYVAAATFSLYYVPQAVSDTVREAVRHGIPVFGENRSRRAAMQTGQRARELAENRKQQNARRQAQRMQKAAEAVSDHAAAVSVDCVDP